MIFEKKVTDRASLSDCLKHSWISGNKQNSTQLLKNQKSLKLETKKQKSKKNLISKEVIACIRQFNYQCKLKEAVTVTLANNMTSEPEIQIKQHFRRLDSDGDGYLDVNELYN